MNENHPRLTESKDPPPPAQLEAWLGPKAFGIWRRVVDLVDERYPGVFKPEWLYGGKKHGWSLRYKKSKSFCTLIPEKRRFRLLFVFGADERAGVENIRGGLSARVARAYDAATTYHDGKWLLLDMSDPAAFTDAEKFMRIKRRPPT